MPNRRMYSNELKLEIVQKYLTRHYSYNDLIREYGACKGSIQGWVDTYLEHGKKGFEVKYESYSGDFKLAVVKYMYDEGSSARKAAAHFNISSHVTVSRWNHIYLEGGAEALYVDSRGRVGNMKKGRPPKIKFEQHSGEDLVAEVQRLRMENEYLKKLNALIQRKEKSAKKTR